MNTYLRFYHLANFWLHLSLQTSEKIYRNKIDEIENVTTNT